MRRLSPLLALPLLAAACAPGPMDSGGDGAMRASSARPCFYSDQVRNFRQGGSGQIFIRDARNQVFELQASGGCFDIDYTNTLALVPDLPGVVTSRVCADESVRIVVPEAAGVRPDVCRSRVIRVLTEAEVEALPERQRP